MPTSPFNQGPNINNAIRPKLLIIKAIRPMLLIINAIKPMLLTIIMHCMLMAKHTLIFVGGISHTINPMFTVWCFVIFFSFTTHWPYKAITINDIENNGRDKLLMLKTKIIFFTILPMYVVQYIPITLTILLTQSNSSLLIRFQFLWLWLMTQLTAEYINNNHWWNN